MPGAPDIRRSAVAGMFYPGDPAVLRRDIRRMLDGAPAPAPVGRIMGVVSPHAGYMYSGPTAAGAYRYLTEARFETVIVIAPSHRERFAGVTVYPGDAYATPLGPIAIDAGVRARMVMPGGCVRAAIEGHREEHAIEVQLPFLQQLLEGFSLVPLVMGSQDAQTCAALGDAIGRCAPSGNVLIVASSDLSHYLPADRAETLDGVACDDIEAFDPEALEEDLAHGATEACGGGPIVAAMRALKNLGATGMKVVDRCTSGDITGDRRSVVGYCAAVAYREEGAS